MAGIRTVIGLLKEPKEVLKLPRLLKSERKPWSNYNYVDWLENYLRSDMRVFEYGSGYSTLMFSDRCKEVFSVECELNWIRELKRKLIRKNVTFLKPKQNDKFDYLEQINGRGKFDIILIDDIYRPDCVPYAVEHVKDGGIIVIDDVNFGHIGFLANSEMEKEPGFKCLKFKGIKKQGGLFIWKTYVYKKELIK